jgi:N-acetylmuramoyl-L-alanine amidase
MANPGISSIMATGKRLALACLLLAGLLFLASCETTGRFGRGAGTFDTVVIDAGHGGHDRGARAVSGMNEKDLCLDMAKRLKPLLERAGFRVVMVRDRDVFVPLGRRVEISNRYRNAIFVSIHYNWARRRAARGLEVFYHTPQSRRLAANILRESLRVYSTPNRGVKPANFYVLRNNRRPAVLLELGFLSNSQDNAYVQRADIRQRQAEAIARGIIAERRGRNP